MSNDTGILYFPNREQCIKYWHEILDYWERKLEHYTHKHSHRMVTACRRNIDTAKKALAELEK